MTYFNIGISIVNLSEATLFGNYGATLTCVKISPPSDHRAALCFRTLQK